MILPVAERALDAHGGRELWERARRIDAVVSVEGLAFVLKRRPFFREATISMEVQQPVSRLLPIGRTPSVTGVLRGGDVSLEDAAGTVLAHRDDARRRFRHFRRLLPWDDLDMAYFANYAFWNYFTFPALLLRTDIVWEEHAPGVLDAVFPSTLPTHSARQRFHLDPDSGLLRRHDYAVDIISPLARAANVVHAYAESDGVRYPNRRIATPIGAGGAALRRPVLIDIRVHEFAVSA